MNLKIRINRIRGQLLGIERMVDTKRDCGDVLQQVAAVKRAIDSLSKEIVMEDLCKYIDKADTTRLSRVMDSMINL